MCGSLSNIFGHSENSPIHNLCFQDKSLFVLIPLKRVNFFRKILIHFKYEEGVPEPIALRFL